MFSFLGHLTCTKCGASYERDQRINLCARCGGPLFARYHPRAVDRATAAQRPRTIWRWHEMMPVEDPANVVSLGEGSVDSDGDGVGEDVPDDVTDGEVLVPGGNVVVPLSREPK